MLYLSNSFFCTGYFLCVCYHCLFHIHKPLNSAVKMGYLTQVSSYFPWKELNILGLFDQQTGFAPYWEPAADNFFSALFSMLPSSCSNFLFLLRTVEQSIQVAEHRGTWGAEGSVQHYHSAPGSAHEGPQPHWKRLIQTQQHLTPNCFVWHFPVKHPESVITFSIDGTSWSPSGYLIDSRLVLRKMQLVGARAVY